MIFFVSADQRLVRDDERREESDQVSRRVGQAGEEEEGRGGAREAHEGGQESLQGRGSRAQQAQAKGQGGHPGRER